MYLLHCRFAAIFIFFATRRATFMAAAAIFSAASFRRFRWLI